MDVYRAAERLMAMDDAAWARHANPWSVWTRFAALPLLTLAVWSRVWLGWGALVPTALALLWIWLNPRVFGPPASTDGWASKGVLGERLFLARRERPIPRRHVRAANLLTLVSAAGAAALVYGFVVLHVWATVFGLVVAVGAKTWFVDRMVWLYEEVEGRQGARRLGERKLRDPTAPPNERAEPLDRAFRLWQAGRTGGGADRWDPRRSS